MSISRGYSLVFLKILFLSASSNVIHVERSGILPVNDESYAIQFYLNIANNVNAKVTVSSSKPRCCWLVEPGDTDCDSMVLIGGNELIISPKSRETMSYIFPTLYPLDRLGKCHFNLKAKGNSYQHVVLFNTTEPLEQVDWQQSLQGFDGGYKTCAGVDLDPRNDCKPVNCIDKYNGRRTFFEKKKGKCVPVRNCYTKMKDDSLPEVAFDKDHNDCKSLISDKLTDKQIKFLHDKADKSSLAIHRYNLENVKEINPVPLNCNHGTRVGSVCVCEEGWGTDTTVVPNGEMRYIFNWCNKKLFSRPSLPWTAQKSVMIAGLGLIASSLLIGWIIIIWGCFIANGHVNLPASELADRLDSSDEYSDGISEGSNSDSYRPRYGVVHTSYNPKKDDELRLEKGQRILDVRGCKRRGWMKGVLDDKDGYFRASHVKICDQHSSEDSYTEDDD